MSCEDNIEIIISGVEQEIIVDVTECAAEISQSSGTLTGRGTEDGYGPVEEIILGEGLEMSGTTLNVTVEGSETEQSYRRHFLFMGG